MIKEALFTLSGKGVTLSFDGEMVKGLVSLDNISNIHQKDTAKEITITVVASEVKVKLPNGEIKDTSETIKSASAIISLSIKRKSVSSFRYTFSFALRLS